MNQIEQQVERLAKHYDHGQTTALSRMERDRALLDICYDTDFPAILTHIRQQAQTIAELRAVVDKLPKTADGVPVVPGDVVWHPRHVGRNGCVVLSSEDDPTEYETTIVLSFGSDNFVDKSATVRVSECYSTLASRKEGGHAD